MTKATELLKFIEDLDVPDAVMAIERTSKSALSFGLIGEAICVMHNDGSVNIFEHKQRDGIASEAFTAREVLENLRRRRER